MSSRAKSNRNASELSSVESVNCDCGRRYLVRLGIHKAGKKSQRSRRKSSAAPKRLLKKLSNRRSSSSNLSRSRKASRKSRKDSSVASRDSSRDLSQSRKASRKSRKDSSVASRDSSRDLSRSRKASRKSRQDSSVASRDFSRDLSQSEKFLRESRSTAKRDSSRDLNRTGKVYRKKNSVATRDLSQPGKFLRKDNSVASRDSSHDLSQSEKFLREGRSAVKRDSSRNLSQSGKAYRKETSAATRDLNPSGMSYRKDSSVVKRNASRNLSQFGKTYLKNDSAASRDSSSDLSQSQKFLRIDNSASSRGAARKLSRSRKSLRNSNPAVSRGASRDLNRSRKASRRDNSSVAKKSSFSQLPQRRNRKTQFKKQRPQSESSISSEGESWTAVKRAFERKSVFNSSQSETSKKSQREANRGGLTKSKAGQRASKSDACLNCRHQSPAQSIRSTRSRSRDRSVDISRNLWPGLRIAQASTRDKSSAARSGQRNLRSRSNSQSESRSLKKVSRSAKNEPICNKCRLTESQKASQKAKNQKRLCTSCHNFKPLDEFEQPRSSYFPDLSGPAQKLKNVPFDVFSNLSEAASSAADRLRSLSGFDTSKSQDESQGEQALSKSKTHQKNKLRSKPEGCSERSQDCAVISGFN